MYTPGYDEENKTKPAITRKIESTDEGLTAEQAAQGLFNGVENGEFHITADLITNLFKSSTRGCAPRGNAFLDTVLDFVALVGYHSWLGHSPVFMCLALDRSTHLASFGR